MRSLTVAAILSLLCLAACAAENDDTSIARDTRDAADQPEADADSADDADIPEVDRSAQLEGDPSAPSAGAIPDLSYEPRFEDYADGHPRFSSSVGVRIAAVVPTLDATIGQLNSLLERHDAEIVGGLTGVDGEVAGILVLRLPTDTHDALDAVIAALDADPVVALAVQDVMLEPVRVPNHNGGAPADWQWTSTPLNANWGIEQIRVPQTWNLLDWLEREGPLVTKVGVLDVGFTLPHADLVAVSVTRPERVDGHGTHVAGIIGATFDNGKGVDGIDPHASLSLVATGNLIEGLLDMVQNRTGFDVINISMGYRFCPGPPSCPPGRADNWNTDVHHWFIAHRHGDLIEQGMRILRGRRPKRDLPFIAVAAGNASDGLLGTQPAKYASPYANAALVQGVANIVVVEAMDINGQRAVFSNTGGHISAPGVHITSTYGPPGDPGCLSGPDCYADLDGTSMASPMVAGAASLIYELDAFPRPTLDDNAMLELFMRHSVPVIGGAANRIDLWPAVMELDKMLLRLVDIDDGTIDGNDRTVSADERGNGVIDMADFRRYRDWLLFVEEAPGLALDNPGHAKMDANGDGRVLSRSTTSFPISPGDGVFPRGDFNGDGTLSRTAYGPVPRGGAAGSTILETDLDVLGRFFVDDLHHPDELPGLLDSGDLTVSAEACFRDMPGTSEADFVVQLSAGVEQRRYTRDDPRYVHTLPVGKYTATFEADGLSVEEDFDIHLGEDLAWEPRCNGDARAPIVRSIRFTTALLPGEPATLEVDVYDPEGAADLGGSTTVTVTSDVLEASPHTFTAADGTPIGSNMVRFSDAVGIARALNDRSNCLPPTWTATASAVDDVNYPPQRAPDANPGSPFTVDDIAVGNVPPVVACDHDDETVVEVSPGEMFTLEVAVADPNHDDGTGRCDELPLEKVEILLVDGHDLSSAPELLVASFDSATLDVGRPGRNGVTRFTTESLTLASPHPDREEPSIIRFTAADDKGAPLAAAANPDCPGDTPEAIVLVRVLNVEPVVLEGRARPEALRPGTTTQVQFTVQVDDPNTAADVVAVDLDLTQFGAGIVPLARLADGLTWQVVVGLNAPAEQDFRTAWARAKDDNGAVSAPFAIPLPVANLPPVWGGGGWAYVVDPDQPPDGWDGYGSQLIECQPIRFGAIFTDPNLDQLTVTCIITGEGAPIELPMTRVGDSNLYAVSTNAPRAGNYTVTFQATEMGVPPPPHTSLHPFGPLVVLPADDGQGSDTCNVDADCDDHSDCTSDRCDVATGCGVCVHTPIVCNDDNACTNDSCGAGECAFTAVVCPPAPVCHRAACDRDTGCENERLSDGTACGGGKVCNQGACVSGLELMLPDCWIELSPGEDVDVGEWVGGGAGTTTVSIVGGSTGYGQAFSVSGTMLAVGDVGPKGYPGQVAARVRIQRGTQSVEVLAAVAFPGSSGSGVEGLVTTYNGLGPGSPLGGIGELSEGQGMSMFVQGDGAGWVCDASSCAWCWASRTSIVSTLSDMVIGGNCNPACAAGQACILQAGGAVCIDTDPTETADCRAEDDGDLWLSGRGCVWRAVQLLPLYAEDNPSETPGNHAADLGQPIQFGPMPPLANVCGFISIQYEFTASPPLGCQARLASGGAAGAHVLVILKGD